MVKQERDECVSCGLPCLHENCPNKHAIYYICDNCGESVPSTDLFKWDGEEWCKECILDNVERNLERAYLLGDIK